MKHVKILLLFLAFATCHYTKAQNGFIYAHLKHISEENSPTASTPPDYSFVLKNSSGTVVSSFSLNDQATADNKPNSGNFLSAYDIGLSHGTGGDGQLWAVAGTGLGMSEANQYNTSSSSINNATGNIYYRNAGSSVWSQAKNGTTSTAISGAKYIDGAYANQCVYSTANGVFFYYNGAVTQISTSTSVSDVTANGGRIAISSGSQVYVYSNTYSATAAPATGGNWISLSATTITSGSRIDMNLAANTIAVENASSNTVKTIGFTVTSSTAATSSSTTLTSPGNAAASYWDVAYDDAGIIYAAAYSSSTLSDQVYSYSGSAWTLEAQGRILDVLTGGAAHLVYGINSEGPQNYTSNYCPTDCNSIFSRQTDQSGNIYWIDDERIKNSSSLNGNGFVISVSPGTYTLTETLPNNSTYDLGRYNIYDPGGSTTGNVNTQVVTYVVTANEVVFAEYVNEDLVPKAITLTCIFQYLQTFDAGGSSPVKTYTYGSGTYGSNIEGTSYHYWGSSKAQDGYYMVVANTTNWFNNTGLTDHTGNSGYFLLVNASYAQDEFYRQRVTNLVPGVSYTIAFWAANVSPAQPLLPNITYGLQDSLGNVVNSATTGTFTSSSWTQFSFTFMATTSRADLFLKNATIGGAGNDLAIDDISINPILPVVTVSSAPNNICQGSTFTYGVSPSGGQWTSSNTSVATVGQSSGTATGISAGSATLTYTYTNAIGCKATSNSVLKVTAPAVVKATDKLGGVSCFNQLDSLYATITTQSNPSSPTYSYAWAASPSANAGLGTANIQNTSATPTAQGTYTYTVTVTDTAGCTASSPVKVVVSNNGAPTVSATANAVVVACVTTTVTLSGGVSGSLHPNYSYAWSGPGTITPASGSGVGNSYTFPATVTSINTGGQYTLSVTDANGCIGTATAPTYVAGPLSVTAGTYATALCSNTVDSLYSSATGGTAPISYAWTRTSGSGTATYSPGSSYDTTGVTLSGATSGGSQNFQIKATDSKGCTATATTSFTYKNVTGPSIGTSNWPTAASCVGSIIYFPASVTQGSGSLTSFVWTASLSSTAGLYHTSSASTSKDTAKPTIAGTYLFTLDVTDANGCEASATSTQVVNSSLTVAVSSNTTAFCGGTSGSASDQLFAIASGGNGTYTYAWGTPTISGSGSSSYDNSAIYNPTVTISGANSSSTFKYPVAVTDGNGCTGNGTTSILPTSSSPSVNSVTATPSTSCATASNTLALTASFSGGTAPYSYSWTPPSNSVVTPGSGTTSTSPTTATATAATAQNYSYGFSITDNNNCQASGATAAVVTVNPLPSASVTASSYSVCANPSSTINLTGSVTSPTVSPYSYSWAGSGVTNANSLTTSAVPAASGTYTISVTDANGCTGAGTSSTVTVDQATPNITYTCGTNSNHINYLHFNETNGTSWLWTTTSGGRFYPDNTLSANNDATTSTLQAPYIDYNGTYSVQITDAAGCIGSGSITVTSSTCTTILAISNLNFAVQKQGNEALLSWSTLTEANNNHFDIQRSSDGTNWTVIGTVKAVGNSSTLTDYSFVDALPLTGDNYYRLAEVDDNGNVGYSPVKMIVFTGVRVIKMYPNPALSYVVLEFNNTRDEKATIAMQNMLGKTVLTQAVQLVNGTNLITLNQLQNLAQGTYIVTIATDNNISRLKLVKGSN